MKCGHIGYGETTDGKPYCVICDCTEIKEECPDLTGRKAKCSCCYKITESSFGLPFFSQRKDYNENENKYDSYYCGCEGFD